MTIKEIAELCGVENQTVNEWINTDSLQNLGCLEDLKKGKETDIPPETAAAIIRAGGNGALADLLVETRASKNAARRGPAIAGDLSAADTFDRFNAAITDISRLSGLIVSLAEFLPLLPRLKALPMTTEEAKERLMESAGQGFWHRPVRQFTCPFYGHENMPEIIRDMLDQAKELGELAGKISGYAKVSRTPAQLPGGCVQYGYDTLNIPIAMFVAEHFDFTRKESDSVPVSVVYPVYLAYAKYPVDEAVFARYIADHYSQVSVITQKKDGTSEQIISGIRFRG